MWSFLGKWYSINTHLSLFLFHNYYILWKPFSTFCFMSSFSILFHQLLILNIVKFSAMTLIDLYHYLSCLQWTPWYQENAINWESQLFFLASILFYHYDQFSSEWIVTFHLCIYYFYKQQYQDFVSILVPTQDVKYPPWQEQGIQEKNNLFPSFYY